MKKLMITLFVTLLCFALTSWLAPKAIGWYFDPPVNIGVNCREAVEWAMARFLFIQMISIVVGLIIGFSLSWKFDRKKEN